MARRLHDTHTGHEVVDPRGELGQSRRPAEGVDHLATARGRAQRGRSLDDAAITAVTEHGHQRSGALLQPPPPALASPPGTTPVPAKAPINTPVTVDQARHRCRARKRGNTRQVARHSGRAQRKISTEIAAAWR